MHQKDVQSLTKMPVLLCVLSIVFNEGKVSQTSVAEKQHNMFTSRQDNSQLCHNDRIKRNAADEYKY